MKFQPITLGDNRRVATGWLVISGGAVRAILTPADDSGAVLAFACDGRVRPADGFLRFSGLSQAEQYLRKRLEPAR
ncbi:hypothetical protein [Azospirillum rugosum]|uniref:hypothetical protein n=1 Tax=Azospirillum rugosum TaxID=416170 RepID=UPI0036185888